MLGDFTVKTATLGREICIQLEIDLVKTKCGVRQVIAMIRGTNLQKDF